MVGAANGLFLLKSHALPEAIKKSFSLSRNFQYWSPISSTLFSLFPGAWSAIYPWELWAHLLVFVVFVFSFWVSGAALQVRGKEWAWLALALGSSPALLSFSICGYPYMSGGLPHAIALLIIFHPRFTKKWWLILLIGLINIELTWHVYQLGKTVFLLYFLAAFFQFKAGYKNRLIFLLLGGISLALLFSGQKGNNLNLFMNLRTYDFSLLWVHFTEILRTVLYQPGMDLPVIPVLGLVSIFFLKKDRFILAVLLLAQWGLFLLLGFKDIYEMRSRRFLMVDFYSIVVLLTVVRYYSDYYAAKRRVRFGASFLALILIAGCAWQFVGLAKFTSVPIQDRKEALPYTATEADYQIHPEYIAAAAKMARMVEEGKKLILIYNFNTYEENTTDPVALPERLYLRLGHERFKENILIFSNNFERYSRVPILPLSELGATLENIQREIHEKGTNGAGQYWVINHPDPKNLNRNFTAESQLIMQALQDNFSLQADDLGIAPFIGYEVMPADQRP